MAGNSYEKPDFWSKKAFSEGYPARSVYKLEEMDEKFGLIKKGAKILDLGAAPGSWTTFALRCLAGTGFVTAVDLSPLAKDVKADNLVFFQGDLCASSIQAEVQKNGPFDLIICDAAPATTGVRTVDTARSSALVELAIFYAERMLQKDGNFVVKIFQGGDQQIFLQSLRKIFNQAKGFKPTACRTESFETYLVGLKKK